MLSQYDLHPAVSPQVLREMRRSILGEEGNGRGAGEEEGRSIRDPALAAQLQETTISSLRYHYEGFDGIPTAEYLMPKNKISPLAEEKSHVRSSVVSIVNAVGGAKRARSPTTYVTAVTDDDNERPSHLSTSNAAGKSNSNSNNNNNSKNFVPSAVLDPPDYQGRSYLFPPTLDPAVLNSAGKTPSRIPRRMLCVNANGHVHGLQVLRWALPHGHLVFAGDLGGCVKVWNPSSAAAMRTCVATFSAHALPITAMCVGDEGRLLSTSSHDGFIRRWDAEAGVVTSSIAYKGGVGCSEHILHPEDNNLVLAAFDKEIALYDVRVSNISSSSSTPSSAASAAASLKPQRVYQGHMGGIMSLAFMTSKGSIFVSSSSDKTIRTWDFRVPVQIRQLGDPSMHAVAHILKHPTKDVLLGQSADNRVRVFDCDETGRLRVVRDRHFSGHTVSGTSCQLAASPDGQYVSSGDATGQVFVWNYDTTELVRKFPAHKQQCSAHVWHPYEPSRMVTGGWDCAVKVWM